MQKRKKCNAIINYDSGLAGLVLAGFVEQKVHAGDARQRPPVRPRYVVDVPRAHISYRPLDLRKEHLYYQFS